MFKRFIKDKSGSSLVLVMICMSFLILLAGAVITTTVTNIYLKASQKVTQENFYETDSILDAVAAGIQNESSEASAKAYEKALGEYNASLTAAGSAMSDKYAKDFLNLMIQSLTGGDTYDATKTNYKYLDSVLLGYLTKDQAKSYIKHADDGTGVTKGDMVLDGDALVLKDVKVIKAHDKQKDYETTLTTDIRIEVPKISTDAHSEYLDYAILADDQVIADNGTISAQVDGNVYSGTVNRVANATSPQPASVKNNTPLAGIVISGGASLKINAEQIITRGDVDVSNGSRFEVGKSPSSDKAAQLWAENVITSGKNSSNEVTIDASSYIADDLEINGEGDRVTLKGKYYGYNYTNDYTAGITGNKLSTTAAYSSSISVNGYDNQLLMKDLNELVLAGRTFISKKTNVGETALANPDIELGESLAVKSSQLSYFVAAVKDGSTDGFVKRVQDLPANNSVTLDDGQAVPGFGKYSLDAKDSIPCFVFNANNEEYLFDYEAYENRIGIPKKNGAKQFDIKALITSGAISKTTPLKLYSRYDPNVSANTIKYFYLNFDDSKAASNFFNLFYENSSQQTIYDVVNKTYVDAVGIQLPSFGSKAGYLLSSGNIMYSDENDKDVNGKAKIKLKIDNGGQIPSSSFKTFAEQNSKLYMSKQLALVDDYDDATNSPKWRLYDDSDSNRGDDTLLKSGSADGTNLFAKLVDASQIKTTQIGRYSITKDDGSNGVCGYIVSNGDVKWPEDYTAKGYNQDDPCFILAKGSVTINSNKFNGLIIAGDDVEFATNTTVSSDSESIEKVFEQDKNSGSPAFFNAMKEYFRKSVSSSIGTKEDQDKVNNVSFENWKKND